MVVVSKRQFKAAVWAYYEASGRHDLPWRRPDGDGSFDPYKILVSEIMLQQTQVARVLPKYIQFLIQFPTAQTLAHAELGEVLAVWSGLGYNRRAKYLWQAAQDIINTFGGIFPRSSVDLISLPGVGVNTAGAVQAYAFNQAVVFLETNIQTVFIHHFFSNKISVSDTDIKGLVAQTLDSENPRVWYWALMDYGTYLKSSAGNASRRSKSYVKQSAFQGSSRQLRGAILRRLIAGPASLQTLNYELGDSRLDALLATLVGEQLVTHTEGLYRL